MREEGGRREESHCEFRNCIVQAARHASFPILQPFEFHTNFSNKFAPEYPPWGIQEYSPSESAIDGKFNRLFAKFRIPVTTGLANVFLQ